MKKIIISIAKFFKLIISSIIKFFDKVLVTPLSRLAYLFRDKVSNKTGKIEKILSTKRSLLYISLILAFVCFYAIDKKIVTLVETESSVLTNLVVNADYNDEAYVVEGIPDSVDIVLMGRKSDLYLAEQLGDHKVSLDLSSLTTGTHKVSLKYNNPINSLDYMIDPSNITVVIYPKVSEVRTLSTDILNTDKLKSTLIVSSVTLDKDEVIIKSHKDKLETVANVKAIVDVSATNATTAGTYTLENVKLVAYDEQGTEISDVEIVPGTVTATVTITSPSKVVPIKVIPSGEVKSGSAISMITSNISSVTVYGDEDVLANVNEIEVSVDVEGLSADKTFQVDLVKPTGTRSLSETSISVKVTMQKETQREFEGIALQLQNVPKGFVALAKSQSDTKVTVIVKGVSSILDKLDSSEIQAYVDLSNITKTGTWDVPVTIKGNDLRLTYQAKTKSVSIVVSKE